MKNAFVKAAMFSVALTLPSCAFAGSGNEFLTKAAQGNIAEIKMGQLAQQKGSTAGVRSFGSMLVTDHTKAKGEVAALASSMSLNLPDDTNAESKAAHAKLSRLEGAEFDREFLAHMAIDHEKDIAEFTKESSAGDGKVSDLAGKQLPVLKKHLAAVQSLQSGRKRGSMEPMEHAQ